MRLKQTLIFLLLLTASLGLQAQQLHEHQPHAEEAECFVCAHAKKSQSVISHISNSHHVVAAHWQLRATKCVALPVTPLPSPYQARAPPVIS